MRTLVAIACLVVAVTSALFLLISFVRVFGGKKVGGLRSAGALVLMIFVLWQSYLLKPVLTVSILYACVPAALAGALLILLSGIGEMTSYEPGEGPERRVPAMALRLPQRQQDEEEDLRVAGGGGRVA